MRPGGSYRLSRDSRTIRLMAPPFLDDRTLILRGDSAGGLDDASARGRASPDPRGADHTASGGRDAGGEHRRAMHDVRHRAVALDLHAEREADVVGLVHLVARQHECVRDVVVDELPAAPDDASLSSPGVISSRAQAVTYF